MSLKAAGSAATPWCTCFKVGSCLRAVVTGCVAPLRGGADTCDKNTTKAENNEEKTKVPCGVPLWVCTLVSYEGEKQGGADIKKRDEGQKKDSG